MKKIIIRSVIFLIPFFLISLNYLRYEISGGDLNRLGKISIEKEYRINLNRYKNSLFYNLNDSCEKKIDILIIGDSFSQREQTGFLDSLADKSKYKIGKIQNLPNKNQLQTIIEYANGDFFDSIKIKYVLVQRVERYFDKNIATDTNAIFSFKQYINSSKIKKVKEYQVQSFIEFKNLISDIIKFFKYTILYLFDDNAFSSPVYKFELTRKLFSTQANQLLVFHHDIENITTNNFNLKKVNSHLNLLAQKLKAKNITLIVLPATDKYDIYSKYIMNNKHPENLFFDFFGKLEKNYLYIDSKKILSAEIQKGVLDIYFADDTHWSPIGSKIIANEVIKTIEKHESDKTIKIKYEH